MAPASPLRRVGGWDLDERVLVVAEIGNNHEGDEAVAADMIRRAAAAGAGAVKLQTIVPERLVASTETARIEQLRRLCLPLDAFPRLAAVAADAGVLFLSTPFDVDSVAALDPLVPAMKIASGDLTFGPLLDAVAATGKPVLLSTGMSTVEEVASAVARLEAGWSDPSPGLVLFHCVSAYPTPVEEANLGAIRDLAGFGATLGYSDHTIGTAAATLSVALGARVIEKHFTLANDWSDFRDHVLAADPDAMADLVARVQEAEALLGDGAKRCMPAEAATATAARRSAASARDLRAGEVITAGDLVWLRPGTGLRPEALVGRRMARDVAAFVTLTPEDVD